jgi:chromosome segregation ATPase
VRKEVAEVRDAADRDMKDALLKFDRVRTDAATAQKALLDARERLARTSVELDTAEKQVKSLEADRSSLQTAFDTTREDVKAAIGDLERQRVLARNLQTSLDAERERNSELVELLATSQGQIAEGLRVVERLKLAGRTRTPKLRRPMRIAV